MSPPLTRSTSSRVVLSSAMNPEQIGKTRRSERVVQRNNPTKPGFSHGEINTSKRRMHGMGENGKAPSVKAPVHKRLHGQNTKAIESITVPEVMETQNLNNNDVDIKDENDQDDITSHSLLLYPYHGVAETKYNASGRELSIIQKYIAPLKNLTELYDLVFKYYRIFFPISLEDTPERKLYKKLHKFRTPKSWRLKFHPQLDKRLHDAMQIYCPQSCGKFQYLDVHGSPMKIFDVRRVGYDSFPSDSLFYTTNIISLLKTIVTQEYEDEGTLEIIKFLSFSFPNLFVGNSVLEPDNGDSNLENEHFELALEIHSHWFLLEFICERKKRKLDPDYAVKLLISVFFLDQDSYELPSKKLPTPSRLKAMPHHFQNSDKQYEKMYGRTHQLMCLLDEAGKYQSLTDAIEFCPLFEGLKWDQFLIKLVKWGRMLVEKEFKNIKHGGILGIVNELESMLKSQNKVNTDQISSSNASRSIKLSECNSVAAKPSLSIPQSLLNDQNIKRLKALKRKKTKSLLLNGNLPSSRNPEYTRQNALQRPSAREAPIQRLRHKATQAESESRSDENLIASETRSQDSLSDNVGMKDIASRESSQSLPNLSPPQDISSLPPCDESRSPNLDSEFVPLMSNERGDLPSSSDCSRHSRLSSDESEDECFEKDKRIPDPGRRILCSTEHSANLDENNSSPPNREEITTRQEWANLPRCSDEVAEESSQPDFAEICSRAKKIAASSRSTSSGVQTRIPWSHNDEQLLRDGIEKYGCSWSYLSNLLRGWDRKRDQVALKDKARNMKVSYLKAGVPLPVNFHKVRLGKKEIASVRTVIPDYEPEE